MKLPTRIEITDGDARLPEEGWYLHGYSPEGEGISIQVRQRDIPDLEYGGRVFVDRYLIATRSEDEAAVIALLLGADFAAEPRGSVDHMPGPITGEGPLQRIRDLIVAYLQSTEYLDIAKHGVKKKFQPWRGSF